MDIFDIANGGFELFAAPFILTSVFKLYREKKVAGVNWIHVAFFTSWGIWNLFYYPHLDQWYSFIGGIAVVVANTIWLLQILHYTAKGKTQRLESTEAEVKEEPKTPAYVLGCLGQPWQ